MITAIAEVLRPRADGPYYAQVCNRGEAECWRILPAEAERFHLHEYDEVVIEAVSGNEYCRVKERYTPCDCSRCDSRRHLAEELVTEIVAENKAMEAEGICPRCRATGRLVHPVCGPSECPLCRGTGRLPASRPAPEPGKEPTEGSRS